MSDDGKAKSGSIKQPSTAKPTAEGLGRRLFILKAAAVLGGAAATGLAATRQARAKDAGAGHQDPEGSHGLYDGTGRKQRGNDNKRHGDQKKKKNKNEH